MRLFDFNKPVQMQKQIIALNLFAAALNLVLAINNFSQGHWAGIASLAAGSFSAWITWTNWKKLPDIVAKEQQRVVDILSGKFG